VIMSGPFEGVRVVEVAAWTFVPGAGAIMADLGADVIKVEPPTGDPQRALRNALNADAGAPNPFLEVPNRGKRSITLDLTTTDGHALLRRLVATADVFLTSYLPRLRRRLRIELDDFSPDNPRLVYVCGSGWGAKGPMTDVGGFDSAAAWSAAGTLYKLTAPDAEDPVMQPAAFYDLQGSNSIAGAVGMALFRRERTGRGATVDVSLLNTGMWAMSPDLAAAGPDSGELPRQNRREAANPIVNLYRTKDGRWLNLVCLQADRFWAELCVLIGRDDLLADERFLDAASRFAHRAACVAELDATFATGTLAEWETALTGFHGVWAPSASFAEVHRNPQVQANGYLPRIAGDDGTTFPVVAPPYQFDGEFTTPRGPAPELGGHTEEILLDLGLDWDEITTHRDSGALG